MGRRVAWWAAGAGSVAAAVAGRNVWTRVGGAVVDVVGDVRDVVYAAKRELWAIKHSRFCGRAWSDIEELGDIGPKATVVAESSGTGYPREWDD